uniref:Uncharacterized protein n=1 Tax=Setaria italica TaxID=4555 RepID=K3YNQ9_SETIT
MKNHIIKHVIGRTYMEQSKLHPETEQKTEKN